MHRRELLSLMAALGGTTLIGGCQDKEKQLKGQMGPSLAGLLPLTERDTKQVREGLPKAATDIVKRLDDDPANDLEGLKRALTKTREEVKELAFSKVTFFVFVGTDGIVKRSEAKTDLAAGNSIVEAIAETKPLIEGDGKPVETFGFMEGLRGVNKGNQLQWLVGAPVKRDGKVIGAVVAGWSLRLYARYLDEHFKQELEKKKEDPTKPNPLAYVFVVKGKRAYGGPDAPDVNASMLGEIDFQGLVKGDALYEDKREVEGRSFMLGARRAPALGDDVIIVAMLSPV